MYDPVQGAHGVMGTAPGPEAIGAVQKVLLVDRFQHLAHGVLDQLVLERRDPNRPCLALFLRDVDTPHRLMASSLRLHPGVQVLEVCLQILPIRFLRDPIHPHRYSEASLPSPAHAVVGPLQSRHIDAMRQGVEPSFGLAPRSFHYLQQLR